MTETRCGAIAAAFVFILGILALVLGSVFRIRASSLTSVFQGSIRPNTYVGKFRNESYDIGARVRVVVHDGEPPTKDITAPLRWLLTGER